MRTSTGTNQALELLEQWVSPSFFDGLKTRLGLRWRERIYPPAQVIWLMVLQRLDPNGSLATAVQERVRGWKRSSRRKAPSSNTGAYSAARTHMPMAVIEAIARHVEQQIWSQGGKPGAAAELRFFLLDGTVIRLAHTRELRQRYPPPRNQFGQTHWPVCRVVVGHDLSSGAACRPRWGARSESEQQLAEPLIADLPPGSCVVADRNFGVFSVAYAAQRHGQCVLLRMTESRARRLAGAPLHNGMDLQLSWRPTPNDRRTRPDLPADAAVPGRLVARRIYPHDGTRPVDLYLFTTLGLPADELVEIYGRRWNIETDLRSLKYTVRIDQLTSKSVAMVDKELVLAVLAYNLVRAVAYAAAREAGLPPRTYSFSRVHIALVTWLPYLAGITNARERRAECRRLLTAIGQCKLPHRRKPRPPYPRQVWRQPQDYPIRRAIPDEE